MEIDRQEVTRALAAVSAGDERAAERLLPLVYEDLRKVARRHFAREGSGHTLQPTALVHEAFLRLVGQAEGGWSNRSHFYAAGARVMRHILINHARDKQRERRSGTGRRVELSDDLVLSRCSDEDVLVIEDLLVRLEQEHGKQKAEIVMLRFYGGLTLEEIARALRTSKRSIERDWTFLRAWLRRELTRES
jgi:RNA polymerase sigma factor (TIGR02999 family)